MTEKSCNRCGACCKFLVLSTRHMHPDHKKYLLNRGLVEDKEQGFILVPHNCQHLQYEKIDGSDLNLGSLRPITQDMIRSKCDIHDDPDRPEVCQKWHGQKILKGARIYVPPGCAFREG